MSLKNEMPIHLDPSPFQNDRMHKLPLLSLRWRLMLWYGFLVMMVLGIFALSLFFLVSNVLNKSAQDTLQANSRYASSRVNTAILLHGSQNWSTQLSFESIDPYKDPGLEITIYDATSLQQIYTFVPSHSQQKLASPHFKALLAGQTPSSFEGDVVGVHAIIQEIPIKAHLPPVNGTKSSPEPVIAILVVSQSLSEMNKTLLILQTLLILSGVIALIGALICSWIIAANVLRPLGDLVKTARSITLTSRGTRLANLHERVPRPVGQDEMAQVVDTFNEMLSALEASSLAQRRFIADASHELRAPLTTIRGNLSFLERHADELPLEEQKTMLSDAHADALRLARLVDELLLLARADADAATPPALPLALETSPDEKKSVAKVPLVDLDHSVLQLIRQLRGRMSLDGSKMKLQVGRIEPLRVSCNEESIRRVLLILLDNALKYTSAHHEDDTGYVKVSLLRDGSDAIIRVQDNGMGITEEDLPHIFERFYRADQARSREGTGLGLSIAQTLVEQRGGQLSAESTPGQGSIFTVRLPAS